MDKNALLEIRGLEKTLHMYVTNRVIHACKHIDLRLEKGSFIGITGKSGSGKSTLLKGIYRTNLPYKGSILYDSEKSGWIELCKVDERVMIYLQKHEIGYVSQFLKIIPRTTAKEIIAQAIMEMGKTKEETQQEAICMLQHFEIDPSLRDMYLNTFSVGEKLRLNIAAAMVKKTRLFLLDVPSASLDNFSKEKVRDLIEKLKNEGTTMLGIFHDLAFMEGLCDAKFNMQQGIIQV